LIATNNEFAFDLYKKINSTEKGNIFFSPYSISAALSMVYEGARGQTALEIQSVFNFPTDDTNRRSSFAAIYNDLNLKNSDYVLQTANSLWAQKDYPFIDEYFAVLKNYYAAESNNLDFFNNPDGSRKIINAWVEDKTNNKIKDLFPVGTIENDTRLVLANAIYFKSKWLKEFNPDDTQIADFNIDSKNTVSVKMMQKTGEESVFDYYETPSLQALKMPYTGEKLSMLVLLPKKNDINSISDVLTSDELTEVNNNLVNERVNVFIPKFTFDTKYQMNETLKEMGMPLAFTNEADFSGMTEDNELKIGLVIHQAFIDVNEEGTEAAAATGVSMVLKTVMPAPVPVFRADHPFFFVIQDNETGNILFLGKVAEPTK